MSKPPVPRERNVACSYLREKIKRPGEDWREEEDRYEVIAQGVLAIRSRSSTETQVADGMDGIERLEAWDDWKPGIKSTDKIRTADGVMYQIEGPPQNWEQRNKYLKMSIVMNEDA